MCVYVCALARAHTCVCVCARPHACVYVFTVLLAVMMFPVSRILEKRLCFSASKGPLSLNVKGVSVCIRCVGTRGDPLYSYTQYVRTCKIPALHLQTILRVVLVLISVMVVLLIPNFSILMALVGSGCCTLLSFILPAVFHWKLFAE